MSAFDTALLARLTHLTKTFRMWGSPAELEAVAQHLAHTLLVARQPGWTFEQTLALWKELGGPFAQDAEEHQAMRQRMYGAQVDLARQQVVHGYLLVWTALDREPSVEAKVGGHVEAVLDHPADAGPPDILNIVLFALIGFVARDPQQYVALLNEQRLRIGGHELRPLHVVAPPGPTEASVTYTRRFTTWDAVVRGIEAVVAHLSLGAPASA